MTGLRTFLGIAWRLIRGPSRFSVADTADKLLERLTALQNAKSEVEKAEIEREIAQLKMIHDLQKPQSRRWWSPMWIGQYLIVVPFGLWWASIFVVSVARPLLQDGTLSVDDIPAHIFDMAWWLIPSVVVGSLIERRGR